MVNQNMREQVDEEIMAQQAIGGTPREHLPSNEDLIETTKFDKWLMQLRKKLLGEKYNPKTGKYETKDTRYLMMNKLGIESSINQLHLITNQIISLTSIREDKMYQLFHSISDALAIYLWQHWKEFGISPKTYGTICDMLNVLVMSILSHAVTTSPISDKEFLRGTTDERKITLERLGNEGRSGFHLPSLGFKR